jgi:beta-galactosidase
LAVYKLKTTFMLKPVMPAKYKHTLLIMRKLSTFLIVLICSATAVQAQRNINSKSSVSLFNSDWQFQKNPDTAIRGILFQNASVPSGWERISLPHTANIEPVVKTQQQWQSNCFYRKFFSLSEADSGKHITIRIDAAMSDADIYLNGSFLLNHKGGYLPFEIDLSKAAVYGGQNCLLVRLNNQDNPEIPPGKPLERLDFNYYSGIYRNVYLIKKSKVYITDAVTAKTLNGGGVLIHYNNVSSSSAELSFKVEVHNDNLKNQPTRLRAMLYDPSGKLLKTVSTTVIAVPAGQASVFEQTIPVEQPAMWSPDHPQLYNLVIAVDDNGVLVDSTSLKTGIRQISFKPEGFYLNGQKYMLRGTNRHQEYPYIGNALSDNAQYRDAYKIKEAGFNFVRCSHYPPSPAFLSACDELGIFVMDSTPGWQFFGNEVFQENSLQNIRDMIHRDRNHTSIILWEASLNETPMSQSYMERAKTIVHTELPYPDTFTCGWMDSVYDVFIPARQHAKAPDYYKKYAKPKPIFLAEYGDWEYYSQNAGFNQTSYADLTNEEKSSRQLRGDGQKRMLQQALNFQEAHNDNLNGHITGDANWLMFDYKRGYAADIETSGIMDIFRLPKFAYYFYHSQRDAAEFKPMLFIANYWNDPTEKQVKIYSNCDQVELFLNGKSLGKQMPDTGRINNNLKHAPFTFNCNYQAGTLTAKGFSNGKEAVTAERKTPEAASQLLLDVDYSGKNLVAGHNDVVFIYVSVADNNGTIIPGAANGIQLVVDGGAEVIGNSTAKAEAGIAAFLIRAGDKKGTFKLRATSVGLKPASLALAVQ